MQNTTNTQGRGTAEQKPNEALKSAENGSFNLTDLTKSINSFVLSPLQQLGFGGFQFDKTANSEALHKKEFTKHTVENGSQITDHVITHLDTISITGFVGEKVYVVSPASQNILNKLTQKLPVILSAIPKFTTGMQQIKNAKDSFQNKEGQNAINNSVDLFNTIKGLIPPKTKAGRAYVYLKALWETNTIFSLTERDGTYHTNMVITDIRKSLREETNGIVDFVVDLQKFKTAQTLYSPFNKDSFAGRTGEEQAKPTSKGTQQGKPVNEPFVDPKFNRNSPKK